MAATTSDLQIVQVPLDDPHSDAETLRSALGLASLPRGVTMVDEVRRGHAKPSLQDR
jgi:hypothetical protein